VAAASRREIEAPDGLGKLGKLATRGFGLARDYEGLPETVMGCEWLERARGGDGGD